MQKIAIASLSKIRDAHATEGLQNISDYLNENLRQNKEAMMQITSEGMPDKKTLDELRYLEYEAEQFTEMIFDIECILHLDEEN